MVHKKKSKGIFIFLFLALVLVLTSCTSGQKEYSSTREVYRGTEGLRLSFENIPSKIYYYGAEDENNKFDIDIKVENKGASYSVAGIYLSGFDPTLFEFEEIPLKFTKRDSMGCDFDIGFNNDGKNIGDMFKALISCQLQAGPLDLGIHFLKDKDIKIIGGSISGEYIKEKLRIRGEGDVLYDLTRGRARLGNVDFRIDYNDLKSAITSYLKGRLLTVIALNFPVGAFYGYNILLSGKSEEFPYDDYEIVTFHGNIKSWPQGLDHIDTTLVATACYSYATTATPLICVPPYPYSAKESGSYTCRPKDSYVLSGGQGAPVAVTKIEQTSAKDRLIFRIHIKNVGRGEVYDLRSIHKCSPYFDGKVNDKDKNVVYVPLVLLGGDLIPLQCSPEQKVRLDPKTKEGIITCEYKKRYETGQSSYQSPLYIELWYGYKETEKKNVRFESLYIN